MTEVGFWFLAGCVAGQWVWLRIVSRRVRNLQRYVNNLQNWAIGREVGEQWRK